jgi:hypothetical protein
MFIGATNYDKCKTGNKESGATDPEVSVRFPALPGFLISSGSETWPTHPREYD